MTEPDILELNIIDRVKNYFELNEVLRIEKLNDFLDYVNLSDVFGSDEDKSIMWNIFTNINQAMDKNSEDIDCETAKQGILEIFEYYGINLNEEIANSNNSSNSNSNNKNNFNTPKRSEDNRVSTLNRESVSSKKLDDLLTRITIKKSNDKLTSK